MSRCVEEKEEVIPDKLKTVFDWCKEGHLTNVVAMVTDWLGMDHLLILPQHG